MESDSWRKTSGVYFVDTNSTCFLCLKEIPPEIVLIDLDDDDLNEQPEQEDRRPFHLHPIYKYLHLHPGKLLASNCQQFIEQFPQSQLQLKTEVAVTLCSSCKTVCRQLSHLCSVLEGIQIKLNSQLEQFAKLITVSRIKTENLENKQKTRADYPVAEIFRKETEIKCKLFN